MLDFTKDTEWYIARNTYARKVIPIDRAVLQEFYREFYKSYDQKLTVNFSIIDKEVEAEFLLFNDKSSVIIGIYNNDKLVSFINIKIYATAAAKINLLIIEELLNEAIIIDIISWLIDYSFYELYCERIFIAIPESCVQANKFLHKLVLPEFIELGQNDASILGYPLRYWHYQLSEALWPDVNLQRDSISLDNQKADEYIRDIILPYFNSGIKARMYSTIIDYNYKVIAATDASAKSIGLESAEQTLGASYKYYSRVDTANWYFGQFYNAKTADLIHRYARMIFRIQQYVFKHATSASYIDYLPYDKGINSYLVTFSPIFDNGQNVIAIQSIAVDYCQHAYSGYLGQIIDSHTLATPDIKLSIREEEVLYLLLSGMTQEQIATLLNLKRPTVAAIIRNQLCPKFNIPAGNTKLVIDYARAIGFPKTIPQSLWYPSVIIHDANLVKWIDQIKF
jgi:predicted XRE-type DNA-binding protein